MKPEDALNWLAIGVGAFVVVKLLKPLNSILSIPGKITDAAGNILEDMRDHGGPAYEIPAPTTTPGIPIEVLSKIVSKPVYSKSENVGFRKSAKSNGALIRLLKRDEFVGYVFASVNEKLGNTNKAWLTISASPAVNAQILGYVPYDSVTIKNVPAPIKIPIIGSIIN